MFFKNGTYILLIIQKIKNIKKRSNSKIEKFVHGPAGDFNANTSSNPTKYIVSGKSFVMCTYLNLQECNSKNQNNVTFGLFERSKRNLDDLYPIIIYNKYVINK
ncbi:hypothetical protein BTO06_17380 [Tenacibaculum sp. SZ-18]|nr:hypothetical protein BTO06_17380 [Tenacibaculum sp. SZ-18]